VYELSEKVRARRKELGLTLEEVAAIVGVTPGALSHVESGRRLPDARNAIAIARALQMDPDELLTLLDEAHAERRADQAGWSRPNARGPRSQVLPSMAAGAVFREMPIEAMFAEPDCASESRAQLAYSRVEVAPEDEQSIMLDACMAPPEPSPRDRARYSPAPGERMRAAEELTEDAAGAIRTLRGMLADEDPAVARHARRMLVELGLRGVEE